MDIFLGGFYNEIILGKVFLTLDYIYPHISSKHIFYNQLFDSLGINFGLCHRVIFFEGGA